VGVKERVGSTTPSATLKIASLDDEIELPFGFRGGEGIV
jgi:hypothetical protein